MPASKDGIGMGSVMKMRWYIAPHRSAGDI